MNKLTAFGIVIGSCIRRVWVKRPYRRQWIRMWAWKLMWRAGPNHYRWLRGWTASTQNYGPKQVGHPSHRAYLAMCHLEGVTPEIVEGSYFSY